MRRFLRSSRLTPDCRQSVNGPKWRIRGCLLGYGPDYTELQHRVAGYVARIFRGASPSDLPIEGPTHFQFAINLKTAASLGLAIPQSILARADEVIE